MRYITPILLLAMAVALSFSVYTCNRAEESLKTTSSELDNIQLQYKSLSEQFTKLQTQCEYTQQALTATTIASEELQKELDACKASKRKRLSKAAKSDPFPNQAELDSCKADLVGLEEELTKAQAGLENAFAQVASIQEENEVLYATIDSITNIPPAIYRDTFKMPGLTIISTATHKGTDYELEVDARVAIKQTEYKHPMFAFAPAYMVHAANITSPRMFVRPGESSPFEASTSLRSNIKRRMFSFGPSFNYGIDLDGNLTPTFGLSIQAGLIRF